MLKSKSLKAYLLILTATFCLKINGFSEGPCPPPYDCPPTLSTIPGTVQFTQDWHFKWDPNNPQELNRNSSVVINVIGGQAPYNWSVSGDGFDLSEVNTQVLSNTLFADETACGTAIITVKDSRGVTTTGSIRASAGGWIFKGEYCGLPGSVFYYDYEGQGEVLKLFFEHISGGRRQYQETSTNWRPFHDDCGSMPSKCAVYNETICPNNYRNANCIDGSYPTGYPHTNCDSEFGFHCFCVDKLEYYEWECQ